MEMKNVKEWLEGLPAKGTRKSYLNGVRSFEEFYGNPLEKILEEPKPGRMVEKFFIWLKEEKGYSQNTSRVKTNAVVQYLKYHDITPKYRRSIGIYKTTVAVREHLLSVKDVQELFSVSDLKEQMILVY